MLDDFKRIVEGNAPQTVQNRMVTPAEAEAVVTNYGRLTGTNRDKFMSMPIANIIEFAMMPKAGRFKSYMTEVETKQQPPPSKPALDQPDLPDQPAEPVAIVEVAPPLPSPPPRKKKVRVTEAPISNSTQAVFYARLIEQLTRLAAHPQTGLTEAHIERLYGIEQSMLVALNTMNERAEQESSDTRTNLIEMLDAHKAMISQISEAQTQIVETQMQMTGAITLLMEKVAAMAQTPPVVNPVINVPAPVVNVTADGGRRVTKMVERDEKGLISKITEGYVSDD